MSFLWILIACDLNQIPLIFSCACVVGYPTKFEREIACAIYWFKLNFR